MTWTGPGPAAAGKPVACEIGQRVGRWPIVTFREQRQQPHREQHAERQVPRLDARQGQDVDQRQERDREDEAVHGTAPSRAFAAAWLTSSSGSGQAPRQAAHGQAEHQQPRGEPVGDAAGKESPEGPLVHAEHVDEGQGAADHHQRDQADAAVGDAPWNRPALPRKPAAGGTPATLNAPITKAAPTRAPAAGRQK